MPIGGFAVGQRARASSGLGGFARRTTQRPEATLGAGHSRQLRAERISATWAKKTSVHSFSTASSAPLLLPWRRRSICFLSMI